MEDLSPVNSKWENIASFLGVQGVKSSYPSDGLRKVLQKWLTGYVRQWSSVLAALRCVGEEQLANELKMNYGELSIIESLMCIDAEFQGCRQGEG